jgi:uncharacterized spore protein YtfJ
MEDVERLLKAAIGEIERVLSSKTVVGDPITIEGTTIIPLVNIGFGFGAGGGAGRAPKDKQGEGSGGITGGGGGIKPVAIVVINEKGVRLEPVKSGTTSVIEKVVDAIGRSRQKREVEKTE